MKPTIQVYVDRSKDEFYISTTIDGQTTYETFRREEDLLGALGKVTANAEAEQ